MILVAPVVPLGHEVSCTTVLIDCREHHRLPGIPAGPPLLLAVPVYKAMIARKGRGPIRTEDESPEEQGMPSPLPRCLHPNTFGTYLVQTLRKGGSVD